MDKYKMDALSKMRAMLKISVFEDAVDAYRFLDNDPDNWPVSHLGDAVVYKQFSDYERERRSWWKIVVVARATNNKHFHLLNSSIDSVTGRYCCAGMVKAGLI